MNLRLEIIRTVIAGILVGIFITVCQSDFHDHDDFRSPHWPENLPMEGKK